MRRRKNESVEMGYWVGKKFHPIRASSDYDPSAVGERHQYAPAKRKKRKKRRNPATGRSAIPAQWTTAKVRRHGRGVQVLLPARKKTARRRRRRRS